MMWKTGRGEAPEVPDAPEWGVVGLGNPLLGDDGAGCVLARLMSSRQPELWVRDLGTDLLAIQNHRPYPRCLVIVDAAHGDDPPGAIRVWRHPPGGNLETSSVHQLSALEMLRLLVAADPEFHAIRWLLVTVEGERLEVGAGLSQAVARAVGEVAERLSRSGPQGLPPPTA